MFDEQASLLPSVIGHRWVFFMMYTGVSLFCWWRSVHIPEYPLAVQLLMIKMRCFRTGFEKEKANPATNLWIHWPYAHRFTRQEPPCDRLMIHGLQHKELGACFLFIRSLLISYLVVFMLPGNLFKTNSDMIVNQCIYFLIGLILYARWWVKLMVRYWTWSLVSLLEW